MHIGFGLAFLAGMATFFATCLLPVLPVYVAYLGGISVTPDSGAVHKSRTVIFMHSLVFVAGFLLIFSMLGFAATAIGTLLAEYRGLLQKIGGALIVIFGFGLMDIVRLPILTNTYRFFMPSPARRGSYIGAFLFGMTFGFAWIPCIGPVLATILFLVSLGTSSLYGIALLAVFALGLGVPFLILGIFLQYISPSLSSLQRTTRYVQPFLGACIIIVGILLITDTLGMLSGWALRWGGAMLL